MGNYEAFKAKLLKDPEIKKGYDELGPEFELITTIIRHRLKKGLTQKQLATKLKTKQPVISRLEQGSLNPSVKFLRRVAKALDAKLEITLS